MKKVFGLTLILSALFLGFIFFPKTNVYAYQTFSRRVNSYGVTNQHYWLQDSGQQVPTDWQKKYIDDSIYQWNSSAQTTFWTPINITKTNNRDQSILDFFIAEDLNLCFRTQE